MVGGPTEPPTIAPTAVLATEAPAEPTPVPLPVSVTEVTETVSPGGTASITAHTNAGADCDVSVEYAPGMSTAKGLDPQTSDAKGNVT
jgi:hypothetical protein